MPYFQVAIELNQDISESAIRRALQKEGYHRRIARRKPPISEQNRVVRLQWAQEHINQIREQWNTILQTNKTWVTSSRYTRTQVIRCAGEEWDPICVVERNPRKSRWIFQGSFLGEGKGPYLFWEKDQGIINKESYLQRIIPLIHGWIRINPYLSLMQDGIPGHSATYIC